MRDIPTSVGSLIAVVRAAFAAPFSIDFVNFRDCIAEKSPLRAACRRKASRPAKPA